MKPIIKNPIIPILASCLALTGHAMAQVLISPGTLNYSQNFDGLNVSADVAKAGSTAPILWDGTNTATTSATLWLNNTTYTGWTSQLKIDGTTRTDKDYLGEFTSGTIRFGNMGNGGNFSTVSSPTTDRALGVLMQGLPANGNAASFGVVLEVGTGVSVTGVTIDYTGEQWFRAPASVGPDRLDFQYKVLNSYNPGTFLIHDETGWTDVDALDFAALKENSNSKLDGNAAANRVALSATIFPTLAAGQFLALRWKYESDNTAAQAGLAVDDLTVSFGPERGTILIDSASFTHTEDFDTLPTFDAPDPVNLAAEAFTALNWGTDPANVNGWDGTGWYRKRKNDAGKDITGVGNFLQDNWGFANIGSDNSPDRALGSLGRFQSSVAFGTVLQAGAGVNGITTATISYRGEQWFNSLDLSRLDFQYKIRSAANGPFSSGTNILSDASGWTDVDALDFASLDNSDPQVVGARDGNTLNSNLSHSFTLNQTLDEGEYLVIRWLHAAKGDTAQYRSLETPAGEPTDGLFVDDLSITLAAPGTAIRITDVSLAGSTLSMTADGLTGGSQYHVEYSPDLTTPFADVAASTFTAAGTTEIINVTVSGTKGFYRVASGAGTP